MHCYNTTSCITHTNEKQGTLTLSTIQICIYKVKRHNKTKPQVQQHIIKSYMYVHMAIYIILAQHHSKLNPSFCTRSYTSGSHFGNFRSQLFTLSRVLGEKFAGLLRNILMPRTCLFFLIMTS